MTLPIKNNNLDITLVRYVLSLNYHMEWARGEMRMVTVNWKVIGMRVICIARTLLRPPEKVNISWCLNLLGKYKVICLIFYHQYT